MRIGSHLSIAQGLPKAALMAERIGANTFQFFTRNPRGGRARHIGKEEIEEWYTERERLDIYPVVGHLPYTVNLAASPGKLKDFAAMVVREDMARAAAIGAEYVVSHPGRHKGDREEALHRLAEVIRQGLEETPEVKTRFLLETMAGQRGEIGSLEDLHQILDLLDWSPRVGICIDSAHLFAAGWNLKTPDGCDDLVAALEKKIGLERVKVMHLNDSLAPLGSHRDRHACIGKGELGDEGIGVIVNHPFLGSLPMLLETTVEHYEDYGDEIAKVKELRSRG
ncbi:deoxyribonuclease IV [Thermanaeromonas sp. C210]|uniref:deoxyribonuclease IV n=1 Tax=Thermanaeromonas sp. C210 TaxID=2731925 RepID=UPI00155CE556|nr:deoxyribonuclease IV [Thermanaeromonas sp. C210]GFN23734.1 putative endonuclease 4 [Thermanaeromonas sp. C210]